MLAIGLMSGTSLDGVDCALVDISGAGSKTNVKLRAFDTYPMPRELRARVLEACCEGGGSSRLLCSLNVELGHLFSSAVQKMCENQGVRASELAFVASHGQTIWHEPEASRDWEDFSCLHAGTLQLGDPSVIAYDHNVTVVSDFRVMDVAAGGQGAPLVPYSEVVLYGSDELNRALLNVGGIGNVTVLPKGSDPNCVFAFDTGPGNMMIDELCYRFFGVPYDEDGCIAASGHLREDILRDLMDNAYFDVEPPKSTGRELFGAHAVDSMIKRWPSEKPEDLVRTATELTAVSVALACERHVCPKLNGGLNQLIVGGGGAHNSFLIKRLRGLMLGTDVLVQEDLGYSSDAKEAVAFAILGNQTIQGLPSNVPSATGAKEPVILGSITFPPRRTSE